MFTSFKNVPRSTLITGFNMHIEERPTSLFFAIPIQVLNDRSII